MLAAAGLSGDLFGHRLVPIGTLYDPFIARGLDSLNYGCYQDARFLLVATPPQLGPYVLPGNNYHVYDYGLFWANIRADATKRLTTFLARPH